MKNFKKTFSSFGILTMALAVTVIPSVTSAQTITRQLEVGSRGTDVSQVQTFLAGDESLYPQGLVTGYYGFLTKSAVSNFQSRNGISPVGRIGPATLPVINAQMAAGMNTGVNRRAPTISSLNVSTSANSANIYWNTDEMSSGLIYFSTSPLSMMEASAGNSVTISGNTVLANVNLQSSHTATLNNLQPNTTYYYVAYSRDSDGNESVTTMYTFRTSN